MAVENKCETGKNLSWDTPDSFCKSDGTFFFWIGNCQIDISGLHGKDPVTYFFRKPWIVVVENRFGNGDKWFMGGSRQFWVRVVLFQLDWDGHP